MMNKVKQTKNTIKIGGVVYGTAVYLKNAKENFNKDSYIRVGDTSYYLPV